MPPVLVDSERVPFNKEVRSFQPNNQFGRKNVRQPAGAEGCSVSRKRASLYLFFCCNARFCCAAASRVYLELGRDQWLWILNLICCVVHSCFAALTLAIGWGHDMDVTIFRTVPAWKNRGASGYSYDAVVADFTVRLDVIVACFFGLSALFHFVWVLFGGCAWANYFLWGGIDRCICPLRWIEYSLSASLMLVSIGLITGLQDGPTLFGVFFLTWTTMLCGLLTEFSSRPEPRDYDQAGAVLTWRCDKWHLDPEPVAWKQFSYAAFCEKLRSYMRRMLPHFVGGIVLNGFFRQLADVSPDLRNRIPSFVIPAVIGTAVIFSLFAFVQMRYQWIGERPAAHNARPLCIPPRCAATADHRARCLLAAPEHYWRTEVHYCVLSLTAKLYLGGLLLVNVISAASFSEALAFTNSTS